jgi:hypothetical protein
VHACLEENQTRLTPVPTQRQVQLEKNSTNLKCNNAQKALKWMLHSQVGS